MAMASRQLLKRLAASAVFAYRLHIASDMRLADFKMLRNIAKISSSARLLAAIGHDIAAATSGLTPA